LFPPLHETFAEEIEAERAVGSLMTTHFEIVQPLASVTVTWYVPADKLFAFADRLLLLHN